MANYVTPQTYDPTKVVLGEHIGKTGPVPFQRIQIRYQNDNGLGPLVVRTHQMFSFGLCEIMDMQSKTGKVVGYSVPFVAYDAKHGKQQADQEFMDMMESITRVIREKISDRKILSTLKQKRKKAVDVESLSLMKCNTEKPGAPPVMYVKLKTAYGADPAKIDTPFIGWLPKVKRNVQVKILLMLKTHLNISGRNAPSSEV